MAVDNCVLIGKIAVVLIFHEDTPGKVVHPLKGTVQIIIVVRTLGNRVADIQRVDADPADDILVDLFQALKIYRVFEHRISLHGRLSFRVGLDLRLGLSRGVGIFGRAGTLDFSSSFRSAVGGFTSVAANPGAVAGT